SCKLIGSSWSWVNFMAVSSPVDVADDHLVVEADKVAVDPADDDGTESGLRLPGVVAERADPVRGRLELESVVDAAAVDEQARLVVQVPVAVVDIGEVDTARAERDVLGQRAGVPVLVHVHLEGAAERVGLDRLHGGLLEGAGLEAGVLVRLGLLLDADEDAVALPPEL